MYDAVDHSVIFEVNRKFAVIPPRDGRLADSGMFFIGEPEALEYLVLGVAPTGEGQLGVALLANGNTNDVGICGGEECNCQEGD